MSLEILRHSEIVLYAWRLVRNSLTPVSHFWRIGHPGDEDGAERRFASKFGALAGSTTHRGTGVGIVGPRTG